MRWMHDKQLCSLYWYERWFGFSSSPRYAYLRKNITTSCLFVHHPKYIFNTMTFFITYSNEIDCLTTFITSFFKSEKQDTATYMIPWSNLLQWSWAKELPLAHKIVIYSDIYLPLSPVTIYFAHFLVLALTSVHCVLSFQIFVFRLNDLSREKSLTYEKWFLYQVCGERHQRWKIRKNNKL